MSLDLSWSTNCDLQIQYQCKQCYSYLTPSSLAKFLSREVDYLKGLPVQPSTYWASKLSYHPNNGTNCKMYKWDQLREVMSQTTITKIRKADGDREIHNLKKTLYKILPQLENRKYNWQIAGVSVWVDNMKCWEGGERERGRGVCYQRWRGPIFSWGYLEDFYQHWLKRC